MTSTRHARTTARERSGLVLLVVLVTILIVALLSTSLQTALWHASRQARLGLAGERALLGADGAMSRTLALWDARAFAARPIGAPATSTVSIAPGLDARVSITRTSPTTAIIEAATVSAHNGTPLNAERHVTRALTLRAPPLPIANALTALGALTLDTPLNVSNTDESPPAWTSECLGISTADAPATPAFDVADARARFDANWNRWRGTASQSDDASAVSDVAPFVTGTSCGAGAGEPARGPGSVSACTNEWGARVITGASQVTLTGASRHQGALLIDGDLVLAGTLDVDGLLAVRGALDASAGTLTVHGAVIIRDETGRGSRLGFASRVRYSRCALRRALAAVATPGAVTTRGWLERP